MATKKTVWVTDTLPRKEFDTEADAIHAERVHQVSGAIACLCDEGTYIEDCADSLAKWILTHFVPKSSDGPQAAYPPKVHGPGPKAGEVHPVRTCNCKGVGYYDPSRHDDTCRYRVSVERQ